MQIFVFQQKVIALILIFFPPFFALIPLSFIPLSTFPVVAAPAAL